MSKFVLVLVFVLPLSANAATINIAFSGSVYDSYTLQDYGTGVGHDTLIGQTVSGYFEIDTALVELFNTNGTTSNDYRVLGLPNMVEFELTTSFGHTWNNAATDAHNPGTDSDLQSIRLENDHSFGSVTERDYFSFQDQRVYNEREASGPITYQEFASTQFLLVSVDDPANINHGPDFLSSIDISQLVAFGPTEVGTAIGSVNASRTTIGGPPGQTEALRYNFTLDQFQITTAVPLPAAGWFFIAALTTLTGIKLRRK